MSRYLERDDQVVTLSEKEKLGEYLQFRKENDIWEQPYLNEIDVIGITNEETLLDLQLENLGLEKTDPVVECVKDNGIFLNLPVHGERATYPTRMIAFESLCKRAGIEGSTIKQFRDNGKAMALPLLRKAEILSEFLKLKKRKANVLIRDEKVSAVLSDSYAIIPEWEIIRILEEELRKEHPNFEFESATISHGFFIATYYLHDEITEGDFLLQLKNLHVDVDEVHCGITVATSDTGDSQVFAYPFLMVDKKLIRIGKIGVKHYSKKEDEDNKLDLFVEELQKVSASFHDCEEQIERLGNLDIEDVPRTVTNIVSTMKTISVNSPITKDKLASLYLNVPMQGTGMDVYLCLLDVAEAQKQASNYSPKKFLEITAEIAGFLFADMLAYQNMD